MSRSRLRKVDLLINLGKPSLPYLEGTHATEDAGASRPGQRALRNIAARSNNRTETDQSTSCPSGPVILRLYAPTISKTSGEI